MLFLMAMRLGGAVLKWGYNQKDLKLMIPIICQIRPIDQPQLQIIVSLFNFHLHSDHLRHYLCKMSITTTFEKTYTVFEKKNVVFILFCFILGTRALRLRSFHGQPQEDKNWFCEVFFQAKILNKISWEIRLSFFSSFTMWNSSFTNVLVVK